MDDYELEFDQEEVNQVDQQPNQQQSQKGQNPNQQQIFALSKIDHPQTSQKKINHQRVKSQNDQFELESEAEQLNKFSETHIEKLNHELLQQIDGLRKEIQQTKPKQKLLQSNQQSRQATIELIQKKKKFGINKKTQPSRAFNIEDRRKLFGQLTRNNQRILKMQEEQLYKLMLRHQEVHSQTYHYRLIKTCQELEQYKRKLEKTVNQIRSQLHLSGKQLLNQKSQAKNKHHSAILLHTQKQHTKLLEKNQQIDEKIDEMMDKIQQADQQLQYLIKTFPVDTKNSEQQMKQKQRNEMNKKFKQAINNLKVMKKFFFGKQYILKSQLQLLRRSNNQLDKKQQSIYKQNQNMIINLKSKNQNYSNNLDELIKQFLVHLELFRSNANHNQHRRTESRETALINQQAYLNMKILQLKKTKKYMSLKKPQINDLSSLYQAEIENKIELPILTPRRNSSVQIKEMELPNPKMIKFRTFKKNQNSKVISLKQFKEGW